MAKEEVGVPMKEEWLEWFGEMVGHVNRCINPIKEDKIAFNPFTQGKMFDVDVAGPRCGFLCVSHSRTSIVIFV